MRCPNCGRFNYSVYDYSETVEEGTPEEYLEEVYMYLCVDCGEEWEERV